MCLLPKDRPISYASRTLTDAELKYDTYEKEALAIIYCVKHFRPYLYGQIFTLVTDHKSLMWFKNTQDANMRILRWRLKLAEYDYEVVYKAGKINVNADALSRNPVCYNEGDCKIIRPGFYNPDCPEDAEAISRFLEESDEEEDDNFELHLSDNEICEEYQLEQNQLEENPEPEGEQTTETALIQDPPIMEKRLTCSQSAKQSQEQEYDEKNDIADVSETDDEKEESEDMDSHQEAENRTENVIESRELLFLRKDNVAYFVDTDGNPLDSGSQKLFERNDLPRMGSLTLGQVKVIKHKNFLHLVLPASERQSKGPTLTLEQIIPVIEDLRATSDKLKIQTLSIAKTDLINNVPWNNVKSQLQLAFANAPTKLIICNGQIKYPPKDLHSEIIREMHYLPTGGHRGVTKTYSRIKHKYYWENLKSDVQKHIQQCLQCQLKKLVRVKTKQPMLITDTPGAAFDKVAMDIVGPLPRTDNGNEYILTLQDQLTKFCLGIPLPDQTSATIAEAFVNKFICVFGAPKAILTDQGRNFISDLMRKLAKIFKIRKFRTIAFHPQSNGSLERSHHALGEYLKQYVNEQNHWDR
ncbi:hypothetical protein DMN91_005286 [Ooceraea biroi]|uniref:RNA-directed DNA polymerase n=1 Tax=Ooceraea biroi TaxID=2015173 RepID=A0A3L8DTB8_OOCBI|nr:uncharacterized protein LOC105284638 [Ooceraea biroi]RLU23008.1 hypothetical protein DMN91_005286 [Ooceraea biroi]